MLKKNVVRVRQDLSFEIHALALTDLERHQAYQQLRAEIFVQQLHWQIPVDEQGRERDRYDVLPEAFVQSFCVSSCDAPASVLGGIRVLLPQRWQDTMIANEFRQCGMIPASVLRLLQEYYEPTQLLEVTRLCIKRGLPAENHVFARELLYASIYALAEHTKRSLALCLADQPYWLIIRRSHFVFQELYHTSHYHLCVIDLAATIRSLAQYGADERAQRFLSLCVDPLWIRPQVNESRSIFVKEAIG